MTGTHIKNPFSANFAQFWLRLRRSSLLWLLPQLRRCFLSRSKLDEFATKEVFKMGSKSDLGKRGEELACAYLKKKGYKIIERNFLKPWGELDIVARAPDGTLVFIEVKTVSGASPLFKAEDQMTKDKIRKFRRTAALYAGANEKMFNDKKGWRLDLIAITFEGEKHNILQYENVV